jgi:hypothetical protein
LKPDFGARVERGEVRARLMQTQMRKRDGSCHGNRAPSSAIPPAALSTDAGGDWHDVFRHTHIGSSLSRRRRLTATRAACARAPQPAESVGVFTGL